MIYYVGNQTMVLEENGIQEDYEMVVKEEIMVADNTMDKTINTIKEISRISCGMDCDNKSLRFKTKHCKDCYRTTGFNLELSNDRWAF